jgi:hypothetical protein
VLACSGMQVQSSVTLIKTDHIIIAFARKSITTLWICLSPDRLVAFFLNRECKVVSVLVMPAAVVGMSITKEYGVRIDKVVSLKAF